MITAMAVAMVIAGLTIMAPALSASAQPKPTVSGGASPTSPAPPAASATGHADSLTERSTDAPKPTPKLPPAPKIRAAAIQPAAPKVEAAEKLTPLSPTVAPTCTDSWINEDGKGDGNWSNADNWSSFVVPGPGDYVCIPDGTNSGPCQYGGDSSIAGLSVQGTLVVDDGSVLDLTGGSAYSSIIGSSPSTIAEGQPNFGTLTLEGTLGVTDTTGALGVYAALDLDGATLNGPGTTTLESGSTTTMTASSTLDGSVDNQADLTVPASQTLTLGASSTFDNDTGGSVSITGTMTDAGTWIQGAGTVASTNPGPITDSSAIQSVQLTGTALLDLTGSGAGWFVIDANGAQTIEGTVEADQTVEVAGAAPWARRLSSSLPAPP
jgi:hypothetical protein